MVSDRAWLLLWGCTKLEWIQYLLEFSNLKLLNAKKMVGRCGQENNAFEKIRYFRSSMNTLKEQVWMFV